MRDSQVSQYIAFFSSCKTRETHNDILARSESHFPQNSCGKNCKTRLAVNTNCYLQEEKYKIEEKTIRDLSEVIREIDRRTMARVKNTKNVSEEEILLDFYSSKYPDLQFIDLPGFTKV